MPGQEPLQPCWQWFLMDQRLTIEIAPVLGALVES
jgi:hypothetical protein